MIQFRRLLPEPGTLDLSELCEALTLPADANPERPFTIAVDANPLTRPSLTGTEVYARELARRLPAAGPELEWVFYASRPGPAIPGLDLTVLPGNRLWSQTRLPLELWQRRPDLP